MAAEIVRLEENLTIAQAMTPEELCLRFATQIRQFANLVARGTSEGDDIAQEALLKAIRSLASYKPESGEIEGWLWRIVTNTANDFSRSRIRRLRLAFKLGIWVDNTASSIEEIALKKESSRELRVALGRLSYRDRALLAMRYGLDMEVQVIAQATGLSPSAASKGIQRALLRLKSKISGDVNV